MTDSALNPMPTLSVMVELHLPTSVVLPLKSGPAGEIVPSTGFVWQKYLDHEQLAAWGVDVQWQDLDGKPMPREDALRLIELANARAQMNDGSQSTN